MRHIEEPLDTGRGGGRGEEEATDELGIGKGDGWEAPWRL